VLEGWHSLMLLVEPCSVFFDLVAVTLSCFFYGWSRSGSEMSCLIVCSCVACVL
jgi:hypothetical protein